FSRDWSSDVCSSDLSGHAGVPVVLDQPPLPLDTPEAIVNATPTGSGQAGGTTTPGGSVALSATEMAFITQAGDAGLFDLRIGQRSEERRVGKRGELE